MRRNDNIRNRKIIADRVIAQRNETEQTEKLIDFVVSRYDVKRTDAKRFLKYGHLMIDGEVTHQFDAPVNPGQWVELNFTRPFVIFRHPRMSIVYEDDDIIVINKGYGLLSVGTQSHKKEENAYDILKAYVKEIDPRNKVYVVHRLDRDTSGLMMFTKTEEAQQVLRHNWNNMVIDRLYVALLEGVMEEDSGVIRSRLMENSEFVVYSTTDREAGKLAVTRYRVLRRGGGCTLAEFSLDTGRKNQIRVHAKDLGHPIVGDRKYGAKRSPINRLALHARSLRFAHPVTRKDMKFELPVPSRFLGVVGAGRKTDPENNR